MRRDRPERSHGGLRSTAPVPDSAFDDHGQLGSRPLNFEPIGFDAARRDGGWNVDHHTRPIGREQPGPPVEGGLFDTARNVLVDYEFADPRRIRAVYDPAAPFCGRDMLLIGRFLLLRFRMGVRVGGVVDHEVTEDGRDVHLFGWHYRTLAGHLEQGQMDYRLCKDLATGDVEASIRAYSRHSPDTHALLRLGFAVVGRRLQLEFYGSSLRRLDRLANERRS